MVRSIIMMQTDICIRMPEHRSMAIGIILMPMESWKEILGERRMVRSIIMMQTVT